MVDIPEFKRDDSLDYTKILRALLEIPFPVGRNLLVDFLQGKYKHASIMKHDLDELVHFGVLQHWSREDILSLVETFISRKMIEQVMLEGNHFAKVLKITSKGRDEIVNPRMNEPPEPVIDVQKTEISEWDEKVFDQYAEFLAGLNDEQKKAVVSPASRVLTIAGAGSGKTSVLVKRIAFLVEHRNIPPEEILAITFTRKARHEMERRLAEIGISGVHVATFNSFAEWILRKHGKDLYGRKMRVLTYADKHLSMNLALYHYNLEVDDVISIYFTQSMQRNKSKQQLLNQFLNDCFTLIDYFRITNAPLYDFSSEADLEHKEMAELVYKVVKYLLEHKKQQGLRSFSDQLVDVVQSFERRPAIIPYYSHVLVDEYQDVNAIQVSILNHLNFDNLFAVGDPRQAIYGWRGSDMNFILNFEDDFGECERIHLVKNYRSSQKIVDLMNYSIKHMQLPDLLHHHDYESDVKLFSFETDPAEQQFIAQVIEPLISAGEETVFVLSRTNRQLQDLSLLLKRKQIPFSIKTDDSNGSKAVQPEDSNSRLILATVHAIKGLEADNVFLMGANKDAFPSRATDHPVVDLIKNEAYDKFEEEKRLFYVALSRARKNLYITYSGSQTDFITKEMEALL